MMPAIFDHSALT